MFGFGFFTSLGGKDEFYKRLNKKYDKESENVKLGKEEIVRITRAKRKGRRVSMLIVSFLENYSLFLFFW